MAGYKRSHTHGRALCLVHNDAKHTGLRPSSNAQAITKGPAFWGNQGPGTPAIISVQKQPLASPVLLQLALVVYAAARLVHSTPACASSSGSGGGSGSGNLCPGWPL